MLGVGRVRGMDHPRGGRRNDGLCKSWRVGTVVGGARVSGGAGCAERAERACRRDVGMHGWPFCVLRFCFFWPSVLLVTRHARIRLTPHSYMMLIAAFLFLFILKKQLFDMIFCFLIFTANVSKEYTALHLAGLAFTDGFLILTRLAFYKF